MQKRDNFYSVFFVFLFLSLFLWLFSSLGFLNGARTFLEKVTSPLQRAKYSFLQKIPSFFEDPKVKKLTEENISLRSKILDQKKLEEENSALLDQFKTTDIISYNLIPAQIVGAFGFLPGVSTPTSFTINKGTKDGVREGLAVVYKDNLVGKITKASSYLSKIDLVVNPKISFAAKTQNAVLGMIKGDLDKMILDNVVLSQNLNVLETVLTYGDLNADGSGYPANLIVGKIVAVDKNPSALFQKAEVLSLLDFSKLTTVFVIIKP